MFRSLNLFLEMIPLNLLLAILRFKKKLDKFLKKACQVQHESVGSQQEHVGIQQVPVQVIEFFHTLVLSLNGHI